MFRSLLIDEIAQAGKAEQVHIEIPENPEYGDYSTNIALVQAKESGKKPQELAQELKEKLIPRLCLGQGSFIERIEIAGPGFVNFYLKKEAVQNELQKVFKKDFGKSDLGKGRKVNVEFVSANPTGPLTMANGRGGFYGDVLANVLESAGFNVTREYYINDSGNQVILLGESIEAIEGKIPQKDEYYKGEYIENLKGKSPEEAVGVVLGWIKEAVEKAGIKFDVWFSENENLRKKGELEKVLELLKKKNLIEEKDGAQWLGDSVVVKSDGNPTYLLSDLAYHYDKFVKRKFDIAITVWGADHHGAVERLYKGVEALGISRDRLHILVLQLVRLVRDGKEVRMGKRTGAFITLDELLEMVPLDAARYFFLMHSLNTHMDFDLELAKERSKKNPVYYVQYAHARACSILEKGGKAKKGDVKLLNDERELALIKKILQLPELIADIAQNYQVHYLTKYVYELAQTFTDFYENCRVLVPSEAEGIDEENKEITEARLMLVSTAKEVLSKTLGLMGISAPEKM